MYLADFIYLGGNFSAEDVVSFDSQSRRVELLGTLEIAGKKFLIQIKRSVGELVQITQCCGCNGEESEECLAELLALRLEAIHENRNGYKQLLRKRVVHTILWYLVEGVMLLAMVLMILMMFHRPAFAILAFIPFIVLYLYGVVNKVPLVEPLYGTEAAKVFVDEELLTAILAKGEEKR